MDKETYLSLARTHCIQFGGKLTVQREQILSLAFDYQPRVVKAYQLLADLQAEKGVVAPPTVYRALEFLVTCGLLHRVEALNGFILCQHMDDCHHESLMFVCEHCGCAEEIDSSDCLASLQHTAEQKEFIVHAQAIVLTGICRICQHQ